MADDDLDAILESALADFEDDSLNMSMSSVDSSNSLPNAPPPTPIRLSTSSDTFPTTTTTTSSSSSSSSTTTASEQVNELQKRLEEDMKRLMQDLTSSGASEDEIGSLNQMMESMSKILEHERINGSDDASPIDSCGDPNIDETIAKLAETVKAVEQMGPTPENGEMTEEMLQQLLSQLENDETMQKMLGGVMEELMSRDVLEQPMLELRERFPQWLSENAASLPKEELNRYERQYRYVQQICDIFAQQPSSGSNNTNNENNNSEANKRVVELMQHLQECGQLPVSLVKAISPEMDFEADGTPKLPGGFDQSQCCVM